MCSDLGFMNCEVFDEVYVFSFLECCVVILVQIWVVSFFNKKDVFEDFIIICKDFLDDFNVVKDEMDKVKKKFKGFFWKGNERLFQFVWLDNMFELVEVQMRVVQLMNFYCKVMQYNYVKLYSGVVNLLNVINNFFFGDKGVVDGNFIFGVLILLFVLVGFLLQVNVVMGIQVRWCCGEDVELFKECWEKFFVEFCDGEKVDLSKILEFYDIMKFDVFYNCQFFEWVFVLLKNMFEDEYKINFGKGLLLVVFLLLLLFNGKMLIVLVMVFSFVLVIVSGKDLEDSV